MTPMTRSPTLSGAARSARSVVSRDDAARVQLDVVDDFAHAVGSDCADNAVTDSIAWKRRYLVAERRHAHERLIVLVEQHDHAVGGHDHVSCFLQRQPRDALDIEQRSQLLREAVNEIDLAIEMQHLGTERFALHFFGDQVIEQTGDGPGLHGTRNPSETRLSEHHRKASRAVARRHAMQQAAFSVLDGHVPTQRGGDGRHERLRLRLAPDDLSEVSSRHYSPSTSRAFCSSASGSKGLVM